MVLTLIGMSGVGKTYWATRLAEYGFARLDCDALVAARLRAAAGPVGATLAAIGQWLGFPDEPGYQGREALYRSSEAAVMRDVLIHAMEVALGHINWVIDTGGSAIYAGGTLFRQLRQFTTVVHLATAPAQRQQMLASYLDEPRSLVWNGVFRQLPGETRLAAFEHSYGRLLHVREQLYEFSSDATLAAEVHRQEGLSAASFVRAARAGGRGQDAGCPLHDASQPAMLSERLGRAAHRW